MEQKNNEDIAENSAILNISTSLFNNPKPKVIFITDKEENREIVSNPCKINPKFKILCSNNISQVKDSLVQDQPELIIIESLKDGEWFDICNLYKEPNNQSSPKIILIVKSKIIDEYLKNWAKNKGVKAIISENKLEINKIFKPQPPKYISRSLVQMGLNEIGEKIMNYGIGRLSLAHHWNKQKVENNLKVNYLGKFDWQEELIKDNPVSETEIAVIQKQLESSFQDYDKIVRDISTKVKDNYLSSIARFLLNL